MFKNRTLLEKLKNKHPYLLDELPATVRVEGIEVPLESATLDEIAFAVIALENEVRPISRRMTSPYVPRNPDSHVYGIARRQLSCCREHVPVRLP